MAWCLKGNRPFSEQMLINYKERVEEHISMKYIFTITQGRSGQFSLGHILNKFGVDCFAEVEPPDLLVDENTDLGMDIFNQLWRKMYFSFNLNNKNTIMFYKTGAT